MVVIKHTKTIKDPNGIVSKLIFEDEEAIAESVVYQYGDRGVICFSSQSGCPVGCVFCGTGNRFIRNLSEAEMTLQINTGLEMIGSVPKIQIMAMSMGEPMLNWTQLKKVADLYLRNDFYFFVSTVGIDDDNIFRDFCILSQEHKRFGLQFSLHRATDESRIKLFRNTNLKYASLDKMIYVARSFHLFGGNLAYFNYIVAEDSDEDIPNIVSKFKEFHITCSVMCNTKGFIKANSAITQKFANRLVELGVREVSVFDPAGQDTIGGGCGQLLYVQEKLAKSGR